MYFSTMVVKRPAVDIVPYAVFLCAPFGIIADKTAQRTIDTGIVGYGMSAAVTLDKTDKDLMKSVPSKTP